jgi:C1A family cysteine protease
MTLIYTGFRPEDDPNQKHWNFEIIKSQITAYTNTSDLASDLRKFTSPRHNQSHSGSCVTQSAAKALELKRIQKWGIDAHVDLSRLALYYLCRELMDPPETDKDDGTYISIAADVLRRFGVCRETPDPTKPNDHAFWPWDLDLLFKSPSWLAMRQAYVHKISAWYKIYSTGDDRVNDVILALAAGNPVVFGTKVYENFQAYDGTPIGIGYGDLLGGHATVLEGWVPTSKKGQYFLGENSWGTEWGPDDGFYKMRPEVIASSDSSDFIVITGGWEPWVQK